jgi:hypothetical protein
MLVVLMMTCVAFFFLLPRRPRCPGEAPRRHPDVRVRGRAGDVGDAAAVGAETDRLARARALVCLRRCHKTDPPRRRRSRSDNGTLPGQPADHPATTEKRFHFCCTALCFLCRVYIVTVSSFNEGEFRTTACSEKSCCLLGTS